MLRQTDFRNSVFNTRNGMTFLTVEMNMIMKMLFMGTFSTALCKIHYTINIDDLVYRTFVFKPFQNPVDGYSVAQISKFLLNIRMGKGNIRTINKV